MLVSDIVDELSVLTLAQIRQVARRWELKPHGTLKADILQSLAELLMDPPHTLRAYHALAEEAQQALLLISVRERPAYLGLFADALDKLLIATESYPANKILEDLTTAAFLVPMDYHRGFWQIPRYIREHLGLEYHYTRKPQLVAKTATWGTQLWGRIQGLVQQLPRLKPQSSVHLSEANWNVDSSKCFRLTNPRHAYSSWIGIRRHLTVLPEDDLTRLSHQLSAPPEAVDFACRLLHETDLLKIERERFVQGKVEWQEMVESSPEEVVGQLYRSWLDTKKWADVLYLQDVQVYHHPYTDAKQTDLLDADQHARNAIVSLLKKLKPMMWYSITEWTRWVEVIVPDLFPLSATSYYPSWILTPSELSTEKEIPWKDSHGRYLRSILTGPLHWLGILDLSGAAEEQQAMCISALGAKLLGISADDGAPAIEQTHAGTDATLTVEISANTSPALTAQIARFAEWSSSKGKHQCYRITPQTFGAFLDERGSAKLAFETLEEATKKAVPSSLRTLLGDWQANHEQIRLYADVVVLEVADEYLFEELKSDESLADAVIYEFSPQSALIRREALPAIYERLKRKGYTPKLQAE